MTNLNERMSLKGRHAAVTGAAGHLGRTMCDTLAEMGATLHLLDRPGAPLDVLAGELSEKHGVLAFAYEVELSSEESVRSFCKAYAQNYVSLDVLVHNAAFVGTSVSAGWAVPFKDQEISIWRDALEVNLTAPVLMTQKLGPQLDAGDGASVIFISSIYGQLGPDWSLYEGTSLANPAAYGATKGALNQMTRWLGTTLAPKVRVNAIAPGGIERGQPEIFLERYVKRTPLGRMATEEDFIGAIAYLSSDLSAYVTGQVLTVDGGWGAW